MLSFFIVILSVIKDILSNSIIISSVTNNILNNYIKELGKLAKENINFSHSNKIGGSYTIEGTQWTIASMVAQEAGIPLLLPLSKDKYDENSSFLSGCYTLGEILEKQGYHIPKSVIPTKEVVAFFDIDIPYLESRVSSKKLIKNM